jgi:hypothetical protein
VSAWHRLGPLEESVYGRVRQCHQAVGPRIPP